MITEIHGHQVMSLILASGRTFTRESLAAFIVAEFGPEARYNTCSAANLTAAGLVDFLAAKGKFAGPDTGFTVYPGRVCQH